MKNRGGITTAGISKPILIMSAGWRDWRCRLRCLPVPAGLRRHPAAQGGANNGSGTRRAFSNQYCQPGGRRRKIFSWLFRRGGGRHVYRAIPARLFHTCPSWARSAPTIHWGRCNWGLCHRHSARKLPVEPKALIRLQLQQACMGGAIVRLNSGDLADRGSRPCPEHTAVCPLRPVDIRRGAVFRPLRAHPRTVG